MALEEQIVAWSKDRPAWQRDVLRRAALGVAFSEADYDQLTADLIAGRQPADPSFGIEHLPQTTAESLPVRLLSIAKPEHVNALESKQPLTFDRTGLTIIYGDNGSGKSGYARLLKRIARARHQEEVLSDVFRDTSVAKPRATLDVQIGDEAVSLAWPEGARAELRQMLFYDANCGVQYVTLESDFPYRPAALAVMHRLIEACFAIRTRIDSKLQDNDTAANVLPNVPAELLQSDAGRFLSALSANSQVATLDGLIQRLDKSGETIEGLKSQELSLRSTDPTRERASLTRQAEKLDSVRVHVEHLHATFGDDALAAMDQGRGQLQSLEQAAAVAAKASFSESLPGVGSSVWKMLWETARRFSEAHAYPGRVFPVLETDSRCVLCHHALDHEGRERLRRFEDFVRNDIQVRLEKERLSHAARTRKLDVLPSPDAIQGALRDLDVAHAELVEQSRKALADCESARTQLAASLMSDQAIPRLGFDPSTLIERLRAASEAARQNASKLGNPLAVQQSLARLRNSSRELELLLAIKASREGIIKEIGRQQQRAHLEVVKSAAATTGISKTITELSEASVTEVVSNRFIRETERLQLQRVTIARTRTDKGALLHQPKLVNPRQQVAVPKVLSEGERTALGLAAFFTEAELDASRSALILDDPVTSLDHIRRDMVASRLVALAENRQVVVFTHDASFVADLKRAAGKAVSVAERSVVRSRAEERKPGTCTQGHPWKAKDVAARLDDLRAQVARMKHESSSWDEEAYEEAVSAWAGRLSETWERIFSQEIVGPILAEGGLEVRPMMVKVLARFSDTDNGEFQASYARVSQWARRHDKSTKVNYTPPELSKLEEELAIVDGWVKRVKKYKD